MLDSFAAYLKKLRETPLDEHTEHTGRGALEALLNHFAGEAKHKITVQHEPRRVAERGAPDFKIGRSGQILGYVEVKGMGENFDKVLKSEQIAKYRKLSGNIILTDYLDFIWLDEKQVKARERLAHPHELEARALRVAPEKAEAVAKLLTAFFSEPPLGIGRSQQLALALATRSQLLRDHLTEELVRQEREHKEGRLFGLFTVFKTQVFHELDLKEFADAFAQMLAYGLFLARLNSDGKTITLNNAREFVPGSFRLIRELVDFLGELNKDEYREVRWVVEEVLSIVNSLDLQAIHEDLSFRRRKAGNRNVRAKDEEEHRLFERDPFIYFYEDYLKAYDKEMRKGRGVYYTPPPIVNFIVRAVDDILKDTFGIADGLADHRRVTVLDFACGTGTFLLEVFEKVFENIGGADAGKAGHVVREHLLRNVYGFEYLIAPYTIAHLKLSQYLKDKGHPLADDERLQVFLTNTLEPIKPQRNFLLPEIAEEVKAAQAVKDKPILVITGNPPYSGHSKNNSPFVKATIDAYKMVDGKPLGEKNPKWLQDDYVKFIRFAQMKMEGVEEGVVGIITNHSWLDNPTFRGMRASLMRTFQQIYVLDLHGNAKKKERAPDGGKDENVFDIEQGVAISIFVKRKGLEPGVWRGDLWGKRLEKYQLTSASNIRDLLPERVISSQPNWLFKTFDDEIQTQYELGHSIRDIFGISVLGYQSHRDHFAIAFTEGELLTRLKHFSDPRVSQQEIETHYKISSNRDWKLNAARERIQREFPQNIGRVAYRPFDDRWAEYSDATMDYPRRVLLDHVFRRDNYCLNVVRQSKLPEWRQAFVSDKPAPAVYIEIKDGSTIYPLFLNEGGQQVEALTQEFRTYLDALYNHHYGPEQVFGYIYAVLHAPAYRRLYADFLRMDFPRIPFAGTRPQFDALSKLGWDLVQVHLLRKKPRLNFARYHGRGTDEIEAVRYSPEEGAIHINKAQHFKPVPEEVWTFHIGGYRVLDEYLKSRKGRRLSLDEIDHVGHVADALAYTIGRMRNIDKAYLAAFPGRG